MTIASMEVVFYTCISLLPGFIIKSVLVPPAKHNGSKYFFDARRAIVERLRNKSLSGFVKCAGA